MMLFHKVFIGGLVVLACLYACKHEKPTGEKPVWDKTYEIIKISIEMCDEDCSAKQNKTNGYKWESFEGEPSYNIFTLDGSKSFWKLAAGRTALKLSDKGMPYLREKRSAKDNGRGEWEFSDNYHYELYLEPCAKYKQSKAFVVRESGSFSSAVLGMVYINSSYSRQYEWKEDELVMPCLKVQVK